MSASTTPQGAARFIQIDEEGYFALKGTRVTDDKYGADLFKSVTLDERGRSFCQLPEGTVWIEAFDQPFVVRQVSHVAGGLFSLTLPYGYSENFRVGTLTVDDWDRFHGHTERGIPFVFSRPAQATFFNLMDEFDDESITIAGTQYPVDPMYSANTDARSADFWNQIYQSQVPAWELEKPHDAFVAILPQLKLSRCRILVLGAGSGNDAAFFAKQGHKVTAVDFSEEAVARGRSKYGSLENLSFVQSDIFTLPPSMNAQFDVVVEHTCYCAVDPTRRNNLVKVWRQVLTDNGFLLGVFFSYDKNSGPPYGSSEWEIRARLQKTFRNLYWHRWQKSSPERLGKEFIIYAQKLPSL